MFKLNVGSISWSTKKQPTVALSSAEAEYIALTSAAKQTVYLRGLILEMDFKNIVSSPTTIFCDNQKAQHLVKNPVSLTQYIIRFHYVREIYKRSEIELDIYLLRI